MEFNGTFTIGAKENARYNFYAMRSRLIVMTAVVFATVEVAVTIVNYTDNSAILAGIAGALPFAFLGAALFFGMNILFVRLKLNKLYKSGSLQPFTQELHITPALIHAKSENGEVELTYDSLARIRETRHDFFLHLKAADVYVIPKDGLSPDDVNTLRAILAQTKVG